MNLFAPFDLSQFCYYCAESRRCVQSADFEAQTLALAERLPASDISAPKVALWFKQSHLFIQALLAAWKVGAEVFVLPDLSAQNRQWADAQDYCLTDDPALTLTIPVLQLAQQFNQAPVRQLAQRGLSPQAALWLKTSGSSGVPKTIAKTLAQFQAEAEMLTAHFAISADHLILNSVSQQHMYGLTFCVMLPLFSGAAISSEQWVFPEMLIEQTRNADRAVIWIASPMSLNNFTERHAWHAFQPKVAMVFSAGGALPASTAQRFARQQIVLNEIYGSTETGVIATRCEMQDWQPMASVTFQQDERGIAVQSAWLSQPEYLSDVLEFKSDQRFSLQGRQDRIMKLAGKRVSLDQVEAVLQQSELVSECYCFKHPHLSRLISLMALTEQGMTMLREHGRKAVIHALSALVKAQLGHLSTPRFWRFVNALPRNPQGKIVKAQAVELFEEKPKSPEWQPLSGAQFGLAQSSEQQFAGKIPLDLHYFAGHFANFPLVPGVVQLEWAIELAASVGLNGSIIGVENLKYQQFVRPNDEIILNLRWDALKYKLTFSVTRQDNGESVSCASGRIVYQGVV